MVKCEEPEKAAVNRELDRQEAAIAQDTRPTRLENGQKVSLPLHWKNSKVTSIPEGIQESKTADEVLEKLLPLGVTLTDEQKNQLKADLIKYNPSVFNAAGQVYKDAVWTNLDFPTTENIRKKYAAERQQAQEIETPDEATSRPRRTAAPAPSPAATEPNPVHFGAKIIYKNTDGSFVERIGSEESGNYVDYTIKNGKVISSKTVGQAKIFEVGGVRCFPTTGGGYQLSYYNNVTESYDINGNFLGTKDSITGTIVPEGCQATECKDVVKANGKFYRMVNGSPQQIQPAYGPHGYSIYTWNADGSHVEIKTRNDKKTSHVYLSATNVMTKEILYKDGKMTDMHLFKNGKKYMGIEYDSNGRQKVVNYYGTDGKTVDVAVNPQTKTVKVNHIYFALNIVFVKISGNAVRRNTLANYENRKKILRELLQEKYPGYTIDISNAKWHSI